MKTQKADPLGKKASTWSSYLERLYAQRLRAVARKVGQIVRQFFDGTPGSIERLTEALHEYERLLDPWARITAAGLVARANNQNRRLFRQRSLRISRRLREEMAETKTGAVMRESLERQVVLIKSLPREAAQRAMNLAYTGYATGQRAGEIRRLPPGAYGPLDKVPEGLAKEILKTGHVTVARANLIARTETTRVSTELTKVRSQHVGSEEFIWRTARDIDVRLRHQKLEGRTFRWDNPPVAGENGERALPGQIYNCRCWAEPLIPEEPL